MQQIPSDLVELYSHILEGFGEGSAALKKLTGHLGFGIQHVPIERVVANRKESEYFCTITRTTLEHRFYRFVLCDTLTERDTQVLSEDANVLAAERGLRLEPISNPGKNEANPQTPLSTAWYDPNDLPMSVENLDGERIQVEVVPNGYRFFDGERHQVLESPAEHRRVLQIDSPRGILERRWLSGEERVLLCSLAERCVKVLSTLSSGELNWYFQSPNLERMVPTVGPIEQGLPEYWCAAELFDIVEPGLQPSLRKGTESESSISCQQLSSLGHTKVMISRAQYQHLIHPTINELIDAFLETCGGTKPTPATVANWIAKTQPGWEKDRKPGAAHFGLRAPTGERYSYEAMRSRIPRRV